jgi:hypothetical protein
MTEDQFKPKGGSVSEPEQRTEEEVLDEQQADEIEDLEVRDEQSEDVSGGVRKAGETPLEY